MCIHLYNCRLVDCFYRFLIEEVHLCMIYETRQRCLMPVVRSALIYGGSIAFHSVSFGF